MVLESFVNYLHAEKRPEEMILFGFIIATIALLLGLWVFPSYASFAMVTFTVMASFPLMVHIMKFEKEKQEKVKKWQHLFVHKRAVFFFMFLFLGFTLAFTFWFLLLPVDITNNIFFLQINTISEINSPTGAAIAGASQFGDIFVNNLRVLGLCVLFSFIFGSGAIFILAWNASVLGVAMATAVKIAVAAGGESSASYFGAFAFALVRFLIHGIPEILAYFIGGMAGAIIAFTLLDYKLGKKKLLKELPSSLKGSFMLLIASIVILVAATGIEVFITPLFIR